MEREFKTAEDLDEHFDYAGPARCLGLLYRDAPGWPFSIGSRRKAREWLERAAKLAPDYPENHLNLVESCLQWHDRAGAEKRIENARRALAGGANEFRRRGLGTKLGRLVDAPRRGAQKPSTKPPQPAKPPKSADQIDRWKFSVAASAPVNYLFA